MSELSDYARSLKPEVDRERAELARSQELERSRKAEQGERERVSHDRATEFIQIMIELGAPTIDFFVPVSADPSNKSKLIGQGWVLQAPGEETGSGSVLLNDGCSYLYQFDAGDGKLYGSNTNDRKGVFANDYDYKLLGLAIARVIDQTV